MTEAGEKIAAEILARGPMRFSRFMEIALYDPQAGYYRRSRRDPFGKDGDFFTASQMQPVFGRLIAAALRLLREEMGNPPAFEVVELGAGRGEMEPYLSEFRYTGIDVDRGQYPERAVGVYFANEFFDALPTDVVGRRVALEDGRFVWTGEGEWREDACGMRAALRRIADSLARGYLLAIDYGFTERERVRFPEGTLMSYRRHRAASDVLRDPGEQDITSHVPFTELIEFAANHGMKLRKLETLARFLLRTGERDEFQEALACDSEQEGQRLRLQLKTLLFGMGETFRCVLLERE